VNRLRRANLTPPTFDSRLSRFTVTFAKHALLTPETLRWIEGLGQPGLSQAQISALALMREGRHVSNGTLRQLRLDSRDATHALADLVDRGLAYRSGGRCYAEYLLLATPADPPADEGKQQAGPGTAPAAGPQCANAARPPAARRRYDRSDDIEALFAEGSTLTAAQVSLATGLGQAMTSRYPTRLVDAGRLVPTAPARSPNRAYRAPAP
jgi:ATP-dependent DNA helicase RecG